MAADDPVTMLVSYYPKKGREGELLALVQGHYPVLRKVGLASEMKPKIWQATDKRSGAKYFIEMFQWANAEASDLAHQTPEVMAVWEPMGNVLETMTLTAVEEIKANFVKL